MALSRVPKAQLGASMNAYRPCPGAVVVKRSALKARLLVDQRRVVLQINYQTCLLSTPIGGETAEILLNGTQARAAPSSCNGSATFGSKHLRSCKGCRDLCHVASLYLYEDVRLVASVRIAHCPLSKQRNDQRRIPRAPVKLVPSTLRIIRASISKSRTGNRQSDI